MPRIREKLERRSVPTASVLLAVACAAIVAACALVVSAEEPSADARFLAGLRGRRLDELAERYCEDQLGRDDLAPLRRADLTIELARTLAEHAAGSEAEAREELWRQAVAATERFARDYPDNPRLPLVRLQGALTLLARGELARREGQLVAAGESRFEEARVQLRAAIDQLQKLAADLEPMRREQSLQPRADSELLSAHQLATLVKRIEYELALARRNQAESYPAESADRVNSLTEAVRLLTPLVRLDSDDPICWPSRIDLVSAYRLLSDWVTARQILAAIAQQNPPSSVVLLARAERIRLALAEGHLPEALAAAAEGRELAGEGSPQLDLARLEAFLAAWRKALSQQNETDARKWRDQATLASRLIEQVYGPYWRYLAGMMLADQVHAAADGSGNARLMIEAADDLYRGGRVDDALVGYDRAAALAVRQGERTTAFDAGYKAAAIEHARNRHTDALRRFRELAVSNLANARAAEAHVLAVHHAAQLARDGNADSLDAYAALLAEHLERWPAGPTADETRLRLGRIEEHRRQWQPAIATYRGISPDYAEYPRVLDALARCYREWLGQLQAEGKPTSDTARDAAAWFESLVLQPDGTLPQTWTLAKRTAALAAAELRLTHTDDGFARAAALLRAALAQRGDASPEWTSAAESLLVFALAGEGRRQEAAETLARLSGGPPAQLLGTLDGLARAGRRAAPDVRRELAELQLQTIALIQSRWNDLHAGQQHRVGRLHAQALADAGRAAEALATYAELARAHPDDAAIQESYAALLSEQSDAESQRLALARWRTIEKRTPPNTEPWYRAKYEIAQLHLRQGRADQAAKMIDLLELLHPEMGGPAMKARFHSLRARCR